MGCCYCQRSDGGLDVYPASNRDQCPFDCRYADETCRGSGCALMTALANHVSSEWGDETFVMLTARGTFDTIYDFRDIVLRPSTTGGELLDAYRRTATRAVDTASRDPKLLAEMLRLLLIGSAFARFVTRVAAGTDDPTLTDRRLPPTVVNQARDAVRRFRELAGAEFDEPLELLERFFERITGATARETLEVLSSAPDTAML